MEVDLSFGAVAAIWVGEVAREMPLVLQVLVVRMCSCPKRPEPGWCHAALSDGAHLIAGHLRLDETASASVRAAPRGYGAVVRLDFETRTNIDGGRCATARRFPPARIVFRRNNSFDIEFGLPSITFLHFFLEGEGEVGMFTMRWFGGVLLRLDVVLLGKELGGEVLGVLAVIRLVKMRI